MNSGTIKAVLGIINVVMTLARELDVGYEQLTALMEQAEEEGREVTLEDIEKLDVRSDKARKSLQQAIDEARRG